MIWKHIIEPLTGQIDRWFFSLSMADKRDILGEGIGMYGMLRLWGSMDLEQKIRTYDMYHETHPSSSVSILVGESNDSLTIKFKTP